MNPDFYRKPAPMNLHEWVAQAISASFPLDQVFEVWNAATEYLNWLDSLPVIGD